MSRVVLDVERGLDMEGVPSEGGRVYGAKVTSEQYAVISDRSGAVCGRVGRVGTKGVER